MKENKLTCQEGEIVGDDLVAKWSIQVDPGQTPCRIDKFLSDKLSKISRSKIQSGILAGAVKVNHDTVKSNYRIKPGDYLEIIFPATEDIPLEPENIPLEIIYEDADLLVINKPSGLVVHPGVGNRSGTLVNALLYHLNKKELPVLKGNPADRPGLVHRIDKNTSGLLVVAKNDYTLSHLARQFFEHSSERSYLALVWGQPETDHGTFRDWIGRDSKDRTRYRVLEAGPDAKEAITHYEVLEEMYYVSLVRCRLETGRTHQIRVHFQNAGHPLFNDDKYGGNLIVKGTIFQKYRQFVMNCFKIMPHHCLHANSLGFIHPRTANWLSFEVPPPDAFIQLLDKWRRYVHSRKEELADDDD